MTKALIFDLDGTLVDSLKGIASALNAALDEVGFGNYSEEVVRSFVGNGSLELARRALPQDAKVEAAELESRFRRHYAHTWREGTEFYPGILELLDDLGDRKIALLSNKPDVFTQEIAKHLFPDGVFDRIVGQSDAYPKKPDPESTLAILSEWDVSPEDACFVGDSSIDLTTARNAGLRFIGVTWGYHHGADLGGTTISRPADLLRLIE